MRMLFLTVAVVSLGLVSGCAQTTAVRVTSDNPTPEGLPFYGHKPILIIDGNGARVETIPNLNERYAVRMWAFISKNHTVITLNSNGTLASADADLDGSEIISLFESIVDKVTAFPTASDAAPALGAIRIYEFVFDDDGTIDLRLLKETPGLADSSASGVAHGGSTGDQNGGTVQPIGDER